MKKKINGWATMTAIKLPVWIHSSKRVLLPAGVHDINLSHGAVASDMVLGLRFFSSIFSSPLSYHGVGGGMIAPKSGSMGRDRLYASRLDFFRADMHMNMSPLY
jgi:hypothetical protein